MKYFIVRIEVCGKTPYVEMSPNMPCLLADKIKKVVEDYFKEY